MEASGHARWFERLLTELQFELWISDPAEIRTKRARKQKTDRQARLTLLREDRFPRIWVADAENRDRRQLLWHRHRLVQMRTRIMNQLHVVALNEGIRRKKALWRPAGRSELESLVLAPGWKAQTTTRANWRSSTSACNGVLKKRLTPPTLLEGGATVVILGDHPRSEM